MTKKEAIKIFEEKKVRTVWDKEEWFFVGRCRFQIIHPAITRKSAET